jgi:hypothetical protein
MSQENRNRLKEMLASGEARLQPLTFSQRELWEASPVPVAESSNHICTFMEVRGSITDAECAAALQLVVDRQEVMRLSILPGKDQPLQFIRKTRTPVMKFSTLSADPDALEEKLRTMFEEPFDLLKGPLYRAEVIRRGPDDLVLAFVIHHAIADGWTLGVFVEDLAAAYLQIRMGVTGPLPDVPLSYTAWGAAERDFWNPEKLEQRGQFWVERLAGAPRLWDAVTDDAPRVLARDVSFAPSNLTQAVRNLARRADATLFSTLLTAFQLALSQWTGATDIVVGTPVANRTKQSVRETMGYCSGNVPIRGEIRADRPLEESVRETHLTAMDAFANAMPFAELVRAVGDPPSANHNPIFDVRFALQNHPIPDITLPGISVHLRMRSTGTARFDLGCEITESGDELEVVWVYRTKVFSRADVENIGNLFVTVLEGIAAAPESRAGVLTTN